MPTRRELLRAAGRHRGLLAAGLAAGSLAAALQALAPAHEATVQVLVASRDLEAGAQLTDADLGTLAVPRAQAPGGVLAARDSVAGRLLAGPVRRGEALTDVRLVGGALLEGLRARGLVGVPVRLADRASAALLRAGDVVDVLAAGSSGGAALPAPGSARVAAAAVRVLAVPAPEDDSEEGALVLLATPPAVAARLAAATVSGRLSVVLRPQ